MLGQSPPTRNPVAVARSYVHMKNKTKVSLLSVTTLAAFVTLASAQSAASTANRVNVPVVPHAPPPAASAGMAASAAGMARAPVVPANSAAASGRAPVAPPSSTAAGMRAHNAASPSTGVNVNATNHASAEGRANGLAVAAVASDRTSTTHNMADTVKAIHEASFAARGEVTAEVQSRLDASDKLVAKLHDQADASGDKSRAAFAKALVEVRKQEKEVRASLRAATKAADETTWGKVQSELAANYGTYAKAVADAEVSAQVPVSVTVAPKS